jgi:hypothetical protein
MKKFRRLFSCWPCATFLGALVVGFVLCSPGSLPAAEKLNEGLALYLPLATDLKDHSPAQLPIKVQGNVHTDPEGAAFDGESDWLIAPHVPLDHRPFAIAFWMRDATSEQSVGLVEQLDENTRLRHFHIVLRKERQPFFGFYPARFISPLSIPTDQEWVHMVFQYTGKYQQIWINGRLICTRETPAYEGTKGVTTIGKLPRWTNVPGKNFEGHLRDFRIYDRVLNHEEIALLANARQAGATFSSRSPDVIFSPNLSPKTQASRLAMEHVLSTDASLPFLEISNTQLVINGQPGQVYTLQAATDLTDWQSFGLATNQTGRLVYSLAGESAENRHRFFRVKVEASGQ